MRDAVWLPVPAKYPRTDAVQVPANAKYLMMTAEEKSQSGFLVPPCSANSQRCLPDDNHNARRSHLPALQQNYNEDSAYYPFLILQEILILKKLALIRAKKKPLCNSLHIACTKYTRLSKLLGRMVQKRINLPDNYGWTDTRSCSVGSRHGQKE